jgi:proline iminopeptidase
MVLHSRPTILLPLFAFLFTHLSGAATKPAAPKITMMENAQNSEVPAAGTIKVEGATLHYVKEGRGTPCIVIGSSIMYPRLFSKELRNHLQLVFLDARHFVPSEPSFDISKITIDTYANDIEKARTSLRMGKIFIVGHSIHGDLALEYARRYPQNVRGVVVIASPPRGMTIVSKAAEAFWNQDASDTRKQILKEKWEKVGGQGALKALPPGQAFIKTYVTNGPKYWYDPHYDCSWIWAGMNPNGDVVTHLFGLFANYDLAQSPGQITAPVFLGVGRYDYVVPHVLWDDEQKHKLAQLSFHEFARSGHTPQFEQAQDFDQALLTWIKTVK